MESKNNKIDSKNKTQIGIYRIIAYFTIYTIAGYIIETLFALVVYGKLESRQGFLYGPFCEIYGVGAVVIILALRKLKNKVHILFAGGFVVGGLVEYLISLFGEIFLHVKWWDYSDKFLNINGRICISYCFFWGFLTVYLLKVLNPNIDKFIDIIKSKFDEKILKKMAIALVILFAIDALITTFAVNSFIARTIIENNLESSNQAFYNETYNFFYKNSKMSKITNKLWNERVMIKIFPNLKITLKDYSSVYAKDYYVYVEPYFLKLR